MFLVFPFEVVLCSISSQCRIRSITGLSVSVAFGGCFGREICLFDSDFVQKWFAFIDLMLLVTFFTSLVLQSPQKC